MSQTSDLVRYEDYNLLWHTEQCLLRLQNHLAYAEEGERPLPSRIK